MSAQISQSGESHTDPRSREISNRNLKPWKPGISPNPGGWNQGKYHAARKACADRSAEAVERLGELMRDDDGRIAYMACIAILERGIGKPREHTDEENIASRISLAALDKAERHALATLLQKALNGGSEAPSGPPPIIEGEASDTPLQPQTPENQAADAQAIDNAKESGE